MGYGSEILDEYAYELEQDMERSEKQEQALRSGVWITKDGTQIKITNMGLSHIHNVLRMLRRKGAVNGLEIETFEAELARRQVGYRANTP